MPAFLKIPVYLLVVLAMGGLVAPPIFWLGQALESAGVTGWLADFPFHRVLSRCVQVTGLVLLWPTLRWIGLRRVSDLGLQPSRMATKDVLAGLLLGIGLVMALAVFYAVSGMFVLRSDPEWSKLGRILLTAVAVSGIEEFVFRGVILGICLWSLRPRGAIAVSAVLFAVLHFIKPARAKLAPAEIEWWTGWSQLLSFPAAWPEPLILFSGVFSLLVAGWILGRAAVATRSLWLPIGLHAGWILAQQSSQVFLRPAAGEAEATWPWVGPNLVSGAVPTGLLPLGVLILTGVLVGVYLRYVFRPVVSKVG
jgi:membrane protease YdiL (CAAX protease family)